MGFSFKNFWTGLRLVPNSSDTTSDKGDLQVIDSTSRLMYNNGSGSSPVVTQTSTDTLTNKTLTAPILNNPTINGGSVSPSSLTITDSALVIENAGDNTKHLKFDVSGVSPSTTRTLIVPNANTTIVGTDVTQTLTNKTLTSPTINTPTISGGTIATSGISGSTISSSTISTSGNSITGNTNEVAIFSGGGLLTSEPQLAISRGGTNGATKQAAFDNLAPTTTKGDLIAYSTTNTRLPIGVNTQVLTADSTQATGMKWANVGGLTMPTTQVFDTAGAHVYTPTSASILYVKVTLIGGGGGGGSGNVTGASGGGGAGGGTIGIFNLAAVSPTTSITIGAGNGGGNTGGDGTTGGTSSFGALLNATGGIGGSGSGGTTGTSGGAGGVGSGGYANFDGGAGCGGGTGVAATTNGNNGGSGFNGVCVIEEFYQ